jgi:hypothetical protein|tara:strand:- start:573 stop:776 length:204 start_codon:yes stop_codon:yes gene_type:complete
MGKLSEMDAVRQELDKLDDRSVSELALDAQRKITDQIALLEDLGYEFMYVQDGKGSMVTSIRRKRGV